MNPDKLNDMTTQELYKLLQDLGYKARYGSKKILIEKIEKVLRERGK